MIVRQSYWILLKSINEPFQEASMLTSCLNSFKAAVFFNMDQVVVKQVAQVKRPLSPGEATHGCRTAEDDEIRVVPAALGHFPRKSFLSSARQTSLQHTCLTHKGTDMATAIRAWHKLCRLCIICNRLWHGIWQKAWDKTSPLGYRLLREWLTHKSLDSDASLWQQPQERDLIFFIFKRKTSSNYSGRCCGSYCRRTPSEQNICWYNTEIQQSGSTEFLHPKW